MDIMNVSKARGMLVQAQNVLLILKRACDTLQFDGTIEFQDPKSTHTSGDCIIIFRPNDSTKKCHYLRVKNNDDLHDNVYACIVVRVQEAGGVYKLPLFGFTPRGLSIDVQKLEDPCNEL